MKLSTSISHRICRRMYSDISGMIADLPEELDETVARYKEAQKKGIDRRNRTAMRHKIQNVVKTAHRVFLDYRKKPTLRLNPEGGRNLGKDRRNAAKDQSLYISTSLFRCSQRSLAAASFLANRSVARSGNSRVRRL